MDKVRWLVNPNGDDRWEEDPTMSLHCSDDVDRTIYFDSPLAHRELSGFFVQMLGPMDRSYNGPLFVRVNEFDDQESLYLFLHEGKWLVGTDYTRDECICYIESDSDFIEDIEDFEWMCLHPVTRMEFAVNLIKIIHAGSVPNDPVDVYRSLRRLRSLKTVPENQTYTTLRNSVPIPHMGLGTRGGVFSHCRKP